MKLILLKDIAKIGKKNETKDVADGYAINYLLPNKLAIPANKKNMEVIENIRSINKDNLSRTKEELNHIVKVLKEEGIHISTKSNEKGHLFANITKEMILSAINNNNGIIEAKMIKTDGPIKTRGAHQITIEAFDTKSKINLIVE